MADPVVPNPPAPVPAPAHANPFLAVALLLKSVRISLESVKREGQAPRWVRIDRVRQFVDPSGNPGAIPKALMTAMGGIITGISYLQRFTLDANDLLIQGDAAKAIIEVSADMVKMVTSDEFVNSLYAAVDQPQTGSPISGDVGGAINTILGYVDKVPEPEDLKAIGEQIYGMLAVEQLADGTLDDKTTLHLDLEKTGRLRLLQYAFLKPYAVQNLGGDKPSADVVTLGVRRLAGIAVGKPLPARSMGHWGSETDGFETVYDIGFADAKAGQDLVEANAILTKLGYATPYPVDDDKSLSDKFANRLRAFQTINDLTVSGALDNATVCRLMHLDFAAKNLKRAKAYRADLLPDNFSPKPAA